MKVGVPTEVTEVGVGASDRESRAGSQASSRGSGSGSDSGSDSDVPRKKKKRQVFSDDSDGGSDGGSGDDDEHVPDEIDQAEQDALMAEAEMDLGDMNAMALFGDAGDISSD